MFILSAAVFAILNFFTVAAFSQTLCQDIFASERSYAAPQSAPFDSLEKAIQKIGTYEMGSFLSEKTRSPIERANLDAELKQAFAASFKSLTNFQGMMLYHGKIYPIDFFRKEVYGNIGMTIKNVSSANQIGKKMPYIEIVNGSWEPHLEGGSGSLLNDLALSERPLVLYRGTSRFETATWELLKSWDADAKNHIGQGEVKSLDSLIEMAEKNRMPFPEEFVNNWKSNIRDTIIGKSKKDSAEIILAAWSNKHSAVFASPDIRAAHYFGIQGKTKNGRIGKFILNLKKLTQKEKAGIYVGIEKDYIEVGFSTAVARKILLQSFQSDILTASDAIFQNPR